MAGCPKAHKLEVDASLPEERPPVTAQEPLALLRSGADSLEPGPRARALALLVENADDPAHWGERAMVDPSDWVRRSAVDALALRADEPSRALLERVAGDPENDPYLRAMAALRAPGPSTSRAMTEALAGERESWRVAPLALAAVELGDAGAHDALVRALSTGELALDLGFLREIGKSGDGTLVPALTEAQERVEEELVLPVASARLMLGDATGEHALRKALGDRDEERRLEALDYLVEIDHPAADTLLHKASADGPAFVTWYADLALAARGSSDPAVFERAYGQQDRELRALAVRFAGEVSPTARRAAKVASRVVIEALGDPDATVRVEACHAARALGLADARSPLEALLTDEIEIVRIEASGTVLALDQR